MANTKQLFIELIQFDSEGRSKDSPTAQLSGQEWDDYVLDRARYFLEGADFWHEEDWTLSRIRSYLALFEEKFSILDELDTELIHECRKEAVCQALARGRTGRARQLADEFQFVKRDWQDVFGMMCTYPTRVVDPLGPDTAYLPAIRGFFVELGMGLLDHDLRFLGWLAERVSDFDEDQEEIFDFLDEFQFSTESFFLEVATAALPEDDDYKSSYQSMLDYCNPARK